MKKKAFSKYGYTLLEILVVIGIIAVLIGIGAVSYSTVQKKSRDAKRKGDLAAIQNAMEQYYSNCRDLPYTYPDDNSGKVPDSIVCTSPGLQIMPTVPEDPLSSVTTPKKYSMTGDTKTYAITATLEDGSTFSVNSQQ